jgi:biopolymer transport protein ExbD
MIGKKRERSTDIPSSSLADIAFLLLIFFLVTTTIDTDRGIEMVLPPPNDEIVEINPKNIITIVIDATGAVLVDDEQMPISEISSLVERRASENPELIVSVKSLRETGYSYYIEVLDELKQANFKRISIAEPE